VFLKKWASIKNYVSIRNNGIGVSIMERSQPEGIKLKMRGLKLRSGVYLHGVVKQKDVKQVGHTRRVMCTVLGEF
jgi:hypothetical protein